MVTSTPSDNGDYRVRVGRRIAAARSVLGLSQADLAERMRAEGAPKMGVATISRWETGRTMPSPRMVAILERVLAVVLVDH